MKVSNVKEKSCKNKFKAFSKKKKIDSVDKIIKNLQTIKIDISKVENFKDFPLSPPTLKGLAENGYEVPTEIQRESLIFSLQGLDILGAAKTGSGKTLAFLIPVLETLFKKKWTRLDGVGALIITPTRELAYQIFETLKKVGFYHDFSAGLIIGGKDLHFEKHRMDRVNLVICTPGRLLQHMDENPLFDCVNLQILVLDEADRCLDMGFEKTMNSIIENLPLQRQTLLFSATQTKSVRDLARLSLKDPKYVSVHENAQYSTPENLTQNYVVCELHDKMAMLWSFIKNHSKHKILVFLSSCKQVKYTFEILCKLRPPIALLSLYGTLHQERRMAVYNSFANKQHVVLLATDIAARGLDFPEVNWVVQLDCPEDANTYIHRAGRTARYQNGGESLLVLLPSEREAMLKHLEGKKIPINEIKVNPMKLTNPQVKMEAFLARDPNLKASAQRAFVAYFKSVFLMKDKAVFNVNALNSDAYARSLGLVVPPRIRFLQKHNKTISYNTTHMNVQDSSLKPEVCDEKDNRYHVQNTVQPQEMPRGNETYNFFGDDSDSEEDLFGIKRKDHELESVCSDESGKEDFVKSLGKKSKKPLTKAALAKKLLRKKIIQNKKVVFTESGETMENQLKTRTTEEGRQYEAAREGGIDIMEARKVMRAEDKIDRKLFRERVKAKHREKRFKEKKLKKKLKDNEDEMIGYSGSESDGSEPDLSWLPDPDKIYGEKSVESSDDTVDDKNTSIGRISHSPKEENVRLKKRSNDKSKEGKKLRRNGSKDGKSGDKLRIKPHIGEQSVFEEPEIRLKSVKYVEKRKKKQNLIVTKRCKVSQDQFDNDEPLHTGLSLKEDEELVLQFLSNNK